MAASDIRPPHGLSPTARAEWRRVARAIADRGMEPKEFAGALERYARQCDLVLLIERQWEDAGCPITTTASNGETYQHPLVKALAEHRKTAAILGDRLGADPRSARSARPAKAPGRPRGSAPLTALQPASRRLQAVK